MNLDRIRLALMTYTAFIHLGDSLRLKAKGLVYHDRLLNNETEFLPSIADQQTTRPAP